MKEYRNEFDANRALRASPVFTVAEMQALRNRMRCNCHHKRSTARSINPVLVVIALALAAFLLFA